MFKQLPKIISDINKLGEASNKLKAIDFSIVGLNTGNIDNYKSAISGISKEQAILLLSTKGLNQAQIDLVLSNEKVTASEIAEAATLDGVVKKKSILTVEQQKQLLSSKAITSEKLAEMTATLGLETAENGSLVSKKALNAEMVKQQLESIGIVGSTQAEIMSMLGLTTAETGAATASNVLAGAMTKLNIAMSANPIGAIIAVIGIAIAGVYGLSKAFDALTDSAEEIDERVDSLIDKYNELKTTADNNASTVESLADEYEELSKGVNNLGENVSLTSEEYDRYNEIVNQIADMFPTLITGYTDEGTAILSLKGNVEQLRDAYKEAQQEAYNLLVATGEDSDGNDIMESYKNLSELDFWDSDHVLFGGEDVTTTVKRDITKQILDMMSDMDTAVEEYDKFAKEIFDTYGDRGYNFLEEMGLPSIKDVFTDTTGITKDALIAGRATVQSYYQGFQSEIDTKLSRVRLMANAFLNTNDFYLDDSTKDELKNALSVMVNSLDEELANSFNGEKEKVGAYVNNIVNGIKDNEEVQKALIGLFTMDTTDMPVNDIQSNVDSYISTIATAIGEDPVELKVRLGFDDTDTQPLIENVKKKLKGKEFDDRIGELTLGDLQIAADLDVDDNTIQSWDELIERIEKVKSETFNNKTDILSSFTDVFNSADFSETKDKLLELAASGELTPETLSSTEEYTSLLDKTGLSAEYCCKRINDLVSAQDKLANVTEGLSTITNLYKQANENGFADIKDLTNLDDTWKNLSSYEEFVNIVGSGTHSMEEMQQAFNKLTSEYLEYTNVLDKVSESEKDLFINQLKSVGISNAQVLVEKKLTEQYLSDISTYDGLTQANKKLYVEKLKAKGISNAEEIVEKALAAEYITQTNALNGLTQANKEEYIAKLKLQGITDANAIVTDKLSAEKQAEEIVTQKLNMTMDEFNSKSYEVQSSLLDEANASNICRGQIMELQIAEIHYTNQGLDINNKIEQLKQLALAYGFTGTKAEQWANLIANAKGYEGYNFTEADLNIAEEELRKRIIESQFNNYVTTSTSVFNGDDDYRKEKENEAEESKETFNWIETKLNRLQTIISELGETASNVFKTLTERSNAYGNEIAKVTEELATQQQAYDTYMQKANSVGLPEEYAAKVRDGSMNIDEISDETVKTQISDYQTWYEKALECLNTVNDLQENLATLNIDRLQLSIDKANAGLEKTQSKANTIQKKIDNEGRVTKTSDYDKLDANYQKQIQYYNKQNELLREQQQYVDEGSEKWTELKKNIRENNTAISDLKDNIKGNKVLRIQIKLDKQSNELDEIEKAYNRIQDKISLKESSDQYVATKDYDNLNKNIGKHIKKLQEQNKTYAKLQKTVQKGSKTWNDYRDKVDDNNASIRQLTQSMIENSKAKVELIQTRTDDKIGKIDSSDELLKAKINNTGSYKKQNAYVNSEIKNIPKRQSVYDSAVKSNQSGLNSAKRKINSTKVNSQNKKILQKIKSYIKSNKELPASLIESAAKVNPALAGRCTDYNSYLAELETSQKTAELYKETSKQEKADLAQEKSDNIETYYQNKQSTYGQRATQLNNKIDLVQAQGYQVSTKFYDSLIANEKKNNSSLVTEREKLVKSLSNSVANGSITKYSPEWYKMCQQIDDVTNSIDDSTKSIVEYKNQLRQIKWDNFDYLEERINQITSETDFMINQLSRKDLVSDDTGGLTDEGKAVNVLHLSKYTTYRQQAYDYKNQIKKIDEELAKNPYDKELIARKEKLIGLYQDSINGMQEEKDSIIELNTQGYDALKNKIGEVISEYEELLDAEKSAYDYQESIADKTKKIATIRKQLDAYSGDMSDETRATVQKLQVSLEDAEKDLKDAQYDKYISDTKDILSDLQDNLADDINKIISNMAANFDQLSKDIQKDTEYAATLIKEEMKGLGYSPTDEFNTILDGTDIVKSTKQAVSDTKEFQREMLKFADKQVNGNETKTAESVISDLDSKKSDLDEKKQQMDNAKIAYSMAKKLYGSNSSATKTVKAKYSQLKKEYEKAKNDYDTAQELLFYNSQSRFSNTANADTKVSETLWQTAQNNPVTFAKSLLPSSLLPDYVYNQNSRNVSINMGGIVMNSVNDPQEFIHELNKQLATNPTTIKIVQNQSLGALSNNYNSLNSREYL